MFNTFDLDGVVIVDGRIVLRPNPDDIIITGRSVEESIGTLRLLRTNGVMNQVFFNPIRFHDKTRESSGIHKANTILSLCNSKAKNMIGFHYEDDEIQIKAIQDRFLEFREEFPIEWHNIEFALPKIIFVDNPDTPKGNVWNG